MTVAIRPAPDRRYSRHHPHLRACRRRTAPPRSSSSRRTRPRWRGACETLHRQGFPYLVAEVDGVLAGYAYAGPYRTRPAYRFTVEDSVYVAPDTHRRGIGRDAADAT